MKALVQRFSSNPAYTRVGDWLKLLAITGSAQVLVQAIGFVSAILIIRLLPTNEYALYTLANSMLANLMILGDSGIASGVMSEGGKVWRDREKLGAVLATGLSLRFKFAIYSLIAVTGPFFYLLYHHGASWWTSVLIVFSIIPAFYAATIGNLYEIAPKLNQEIIPLQKIQVGTASGRMVLSILSLFALPFTFIATFASGIAQIWANRRTFKVSAIFADPAQQPDPVVRKRLLSMSKRMLPEAIYICISAQITIWLISFFGSTSAVAEAGALTRLTTVINLFSMLFAAIIVPRFARMLNGHLLMRRYVQIQLGMLILGVAAIALIWIFSSQILWILGPAYVNLRVELLLMMTGSGIYVIGQSCFLLCTSKTWVINPAISIPISICTIAISVFTIDISTLAGLFTLNIVVATVHFLMHSGYGFLKILNLRNQEN